MMHTEIAFANERAIIADMLINLLTKCERQRDNQCLAHAQLRKLRDRIG